MAEHICAEVPHRQFVFTIPKRLRIYFRFGLGQLQEHAAILKLFLRREQRLQTPPDRAALVDQLLRLFSFIPKPFPGHFLFESGESFL